MSYFVQQHLLHRIHICTLDKVFGEGDSLLGVVTEPRPSNRAVKTEGVVHQTVLLK